MIHIEYTGSIETLNTAVTYVNHLFTYKPFLNAICTAKQFYLSDISPQKITEIIKNSNLHMSINLYWPISATKQAHVYDDPQKPSVINLNRHMLDRPVHSISNTLVHQCIHALNAINPEYSFGHGDNSNEGKEKTAPYWIAALAQKLVGNNTHDIDTVVHEDESAIKELQKNNSAYLLHELCEGGILCVYDHISILENK